MYRTIAALTLTLAFGMALPAASQEAAPADGAAQGEPTAVADPAAALVDQADALAQRQDFAAALTLLNDALAQTPDSIVLLKARARVLDATGRPALAQADRDRASGLAESPAPAAEAPAPAANAEKPGAAPEAGAAPETAAATPEPAPEAPAVAFDPAALMAPAFRVVEGVAGAPDTLVFLHGAADLDREAEIDRAALTKAVVAGQIRVDNLFTYSGQDSSIWGALALICAGPVALPDIERALTGPDAKAAFAALDDDGDRAPFEALVGKAYRMAGLDPALLEGCAFDRGFALDYLAEWSRQYRRTGWGGSNFYDSWPLLVLDGTPVSAATLNQKLAQLAAGPVAAPAPAAQADTAPAEAAPEPAAPAASPAPAPAPPAPAAPEPAPRFAPRVLGTPGDRLAGELKGVWAPGLAACLAYLDGIAAPKALDAALPAMTPADESLPGTILLTSYGAVLFDPAASACTVDSGNAAAPDGTASLTCRAERGVGAEQPMELTRRSPDGGAPRLAVSYAGKPAGTLRQCVTLGQLSGRFAGLWKIDKVTCTATAPMRKAALTFAPGPSATLTLTVAPDDPVPSAGPVTLTATVDGTALMRGKARKAANGWTLSLGPFAEAAKALSTGLFFSLDASDAAAAPLGLDLPLLGSGAAMRALSACLTK